MSKDRLDRIEDIGIARWETFGIHHAIAISNNQAALKQLEKVLQREGYATEVVQADSDVYNLIGRRLPATQNGG